MTAKQLVWSRRYVKALHKHLEGRSGAGIASAHGLGAEALAAGLQTLDLAKLHEQTLIAYLKPDCSVGTRLSMIKKAGAFFASAIIPIDVTQQVHHKTSAEIQSFVDALSQRTVDLAATNLDLSREIAQRKAAELALRKSERHYSVLLAKSDRLQDELRHLSRQVLLAQEEERKEISRELHDVIAQTLTVINVRLSTLASNAALSTKGLDRKIAETQKLVLKSVEIVHQFARELRPAALDDLGLIPALHSFMKSFAVRTGVRAELKAYSGVEKLDTGKRTVLFRVAQEALTNVGRHAKASLVQVRIEEEARGIVMRIKDNGRAFNVNKVMLSGNAKRLGLLGMRERLEMVGGSLQVDSEPGVGTTIVASVPRGKMPSREPKSRPGLESSEKAPPSETEPL